MTNAAIELHDSRVMSVRDDGADVVIELDADVHVKATREWAALRIEPNGEAKYIERVGTADS